MAGGIAGARGFLFCDLRDYSSFVDRHGDRAAAELLDIYRALVRSVIAEHAGAEIRTEGDSVYVVFPTASAAIEAGLAIVARAGEASTTGRPIRVGVGVHAGETVETSEGLVGGAVNIAARVCAAAQAGEVLVTDTVRSLTRGSLPYAFVSLGSRHLKGIAGGVALYRVEAVRQGRAAHLRRRLGASRRGSAFVVALGAIALVVGAAAWSANRPGDCLDLPADTKDVVARIDPARMCVVETAPVGRRPNAIVANGSDVFVGNESDWTVTRIDLASRQPDLTLGMPGDPISMAVQPDGRVDVLAWDDRTNATLRSARTGLLHRIMTISKDGRLATAQALVPEGTTAGNWESPATDSSYSGLAAASGRTWVVSRRGSLLRLAIGDAPGAPGTTQVARADVPTFGGDWDPRPRLIATTGGSVWLADEEGQDLYRFDATADAPTGSVTLGGTGTRAMAGSSAALWLLGKDGMLSRVDAATNAMERVELPEPATGLAVGPDSVWLLDEGSRTVRSVDPESGDTLGTVKVGGVPANAVVADGSVWVTVHAP